MDVKFALQLVGALVTAGGLLFALYQYTIAQKWKRSEFAAKYLEELSTDPELDLCCKLLDWSLRQVPVPEKYRALTSETKFQHDWNVLIEAMQPEDRGGQFTWEQMLYRDVFDHFFCYLERVNASITVKLISIRDVAPLRYWVGQLARPRFAEDKQKSVFLDFIDHYGYEGASKLMARFAVTANQ